MRNLTRWSPGHARWSEARVRILAVAAVLCAWSCSPSPAITVQEGDIVFQTSRSAQSQAVQLATHSPYSHMGLVLFRDGKPFVFEAIARVQFTPFVEWIHRGEEGRYVVKRLRDPELLGDPARLSALKRSALAFAGRPYDPYFEWSDDRIYCSELVWKAYDRGIGVQLGSLARLSTFDLSNLLVKTKLAERYGDKVPLDERVISPAAVFASPLLQEAR
ncbi:MAG TPA: YiiX family permuted papain-like enzyme [Candidatus Dormibacteraeota bacterium]|nr:YiiX family permuted papain-like enzyme [Candidatus Dormibacteraeota bacterium]